MRQIDNWDDIQESNGYDSPAPGGYIAVIRHVTDKEAKEYLEIEWDFFEGAYKDNNQDTYDRAGFWPITLRKSYKEKALGFFKAFKTAVESSNRNYSFDTRNPCGLEGKLMGVVIGDEEYSKKDGSKGTRQYVVEVRSVQAIQKGDFKVPALKPLSASTPPARSSSGDFYSTTSGQFASLDESDGDLPF